MRRNIFIIALIFIYIQVNAQLVFYNADNFPLLGKISSETETVYERLPAYLKDITRPSLWNLGKNTAGLAVRFRSNSTQIASKWVLTNNNEMNHMSSTGIKGLDLYALENDEWIFVNSARPTGKDNQTVVISNMNGKMREYILFLPLYDGVILLEIGVDSLSVICQPEIDLTVRHNPVICYGTSILQGGCASRPGMAYTNILSRWLNREFINLGFSGNGKLDYEIAELISLSNASIILLDFVPNVGVKEIEEKMEIFYRIIRNKLPDVPIVFIENPEYPRSKFNLEEQRSIREKNGALNRVFNLLKQSGEKNITLISSKGMIGTDNEATVDGAHFTDIGFIRYAEHLLPFLDELIKSTLTD